MNKNYRSEAVDAVEEQFGNIEEYVEDILAWVDEAINNLSAAQTILNKDSYDVEELDDEMSSLNLNLYDTKKVLKELLLKVR